MDIQQICETYVANTYRRYPVTFVRGAGAHLWDEAGREYIDLGSGKHIHIVNTFLNTKHLNKDTVRQAVDELVRQGAQVIVASMAFGVDDNAPEQMVYEVCTEKNLPTTMASDITKLYGLTRRTRTAAINASILPHMLDPANSPEASVHVGEIVPKLEFYDYNSKYYDDTADLYLPARISDEETQLIRQTAVKAFKALGCRGLARVDFFLLPDGSCVLNEPNTLPGFTKISMYPKLFIDSGLSYPEIIDRLITLAIEAQ